MATYRTTLFDTWQPGTTASAEARLFQVPQGGDATHTDLFTNMRGAGQLPAGERFTADKLGLAVNAALPQADIEKVASGGLIEVLVKDKVVFSAPTRKCWQDSDFAGHFTQATAALITAIGPSGDGFELEPPIVIDGGTRFAVRCKQGVALSAALNVVVMLEGVLEIPD